MIAFNPLNSAVSLYPTGCAHVVPEYESVLRHSVHNARHWKHGAKHGHGQTGQGSYRHNVLAIYGPHLPEHLDQRRIFIHLIIRHCNEKRFRQSTWQLYRGKFTYLVQ